MEKIDIKGPKKMKEFAAEFARELSGGTVLALHGELGSGKTTFVGGLAEGLGVGHNVTSPTFNVMKLYAVDSSCGPVQDKKIMRLYHIDCYRIDSPEDLRNLGFHEWLSDAHGLVVVEWAAKVRGLLPADAIELRFVHLGDDCRRIEITGRQ